MADQKISQLNSLLGANTASGDLVTVVDISDTTMGASGTNKKMTLAEFQASPVSAGTANGVLFLNGTKVPSSGAALTFDGTNLGVGTASPTTRLHVQGSGDVARFTNGSRDAYFALDSAGFTLFTGAGQTGSGLYARGSDQTLQLWTNSSAKVWLDSSGNLGIGTSSPLAKLHVSTSGVGYELSPNSAAAGNGTLIESYSRTGSIYVPIRAIAEYHRWDAAAGERMRLDASGNLGIGTASPGTRLHVQAGTAATGNSAFFANQDGTNNPYLQIQHSSVGVKLFNSSSAGGSANNLIFGNGSTAETMRIDANGNVIVGTAALATTATAGFPWIPSCAGIPTGAPTAPYTNAAAMVVDTTNNRLYVRVGSTWRYATLT